MNKEKWNILLQMMPQLSRKERPDSKEESAGFKFGLELAESEYTHPHCIAVDSSEMQRSFCFHHGRMSETAVLLLHGFTACPYEMRELGHTLFKKGYNVFGARLAGHGTTVVDFANSTRLDWLNSAEKGLAITALLGKKVTVIGESMGGCLATLVTSRFPVLINELILCAPCFRIANPMAVFTTWEWVRRLIPQTQLGVLETWQIPYWYGAIPTTAVAELVKLARQARQTAADLTVPVLIIQARNDRAVKYRGAEAFFKRLQRLSRDQKELRLFDEGHHNLTIDLNPAKEEVFQWISDRIGGNAINSGEGP